MGLGLVSHSNSKLNISSKGFATLETETKDVKPADVEDETASAHESSANYFEHPAALTPKQKIEQVKKLKLGLLEWLLSNTLKRKNVRLCPHGDNASVEVRGHASNRARNQGPRANRRKRKRIAKKKKKKRKKHQTKSPAPSPNTWSSWWGRRR